VTRIVGWAVATAATVALLFGFHTSTAGPMAASTDTVAAAPPASSSGATAAGAVTGAVAQTRWGPVQVQITVENGRITGVTVPQYPDGNGRDRQINDVALPELVQETLSAQSADIDMVSGATVTSDGYLESLQSALDQAGL
jgi:uncharacterized protein with FMN-binding domain